MTTTFREFIGRIILTLGWFLALVLFIPSLGWSEWVFAKLTYWVWTSFAPSIEECISHNIVWMKYGINWYSDISKEIAKNA